MKPLLGSLVLFLVGIQVDSFAQTHWAFVPADSEIVAPETGSEGIAHPIDRMVEARLQSFGFGLAPEADRATLLRRLSFDLTGLPPDPQSLRRFLEDPRPDAYEKVVEDLLASPGFGEHWAQRWLDVARFAESDGFEHDQPRTRAWEYRDWVIQALNADMPFDRFVRWQIAGDLLEPEIEEAHIATGFLMSGPDMPDINLREERRHTVLNEMTSTVGSAILGLGVGCAQCHTHKFDPISLREFYQLRAFFNDAAIPKRFQQLPPRFEVTPEPVPQPTTMVRGDFRRPGSAVEPGFIAALGTFSSEGEEATPMDRRHLARWLTSGDNPLTGRVAANRLWMGLFGRPLVETPNDFGTLGASPTHPELLDWVSKEWERLGWSWKAVIFRVVTSQTYRQASFGSGAAWEARIAADPENRWLSRANRKRLTGEMARDALLRASGSLNRQAGGPGFRPPLPPEVTVTLLKGQWPVTEEPAQWNRRSVYLFARRNLRFPLFEVMDRPDALESCGRRHESTIAPQALTFLNSPFVTENADELARALFDVFEARGMAEGIDEVFLRVCGRFPTEAEGVASRAFFDEVAPASASSSPSLSGVSAFCHAVLNTNGFVYYD